MKNACGAFKLHQETIWLKTIEHSLLTFPTTGTKRSDIVRNADASQFPKSVSEYSMSNLLGPRKHAPVMTDPAEKMGRSVYSKDLCSRF